MKYKESLKYNEQENRVVLYSKYASSNENQMTAMKEMDRVYSDILREHLAKK